MKRIFYILAIATIGLTSCADLLNTTPEDGIGSLEMWTTAEHADLGMVAAYSPIKAFPIGSDPASPAGCISSNPLTDSYTIYAFVWGTGFDDTGCRYFCNNSATTSYGVFSSKWKADYTGVQYANLAIANVTKMQNILTEEKFNNYLGEAHFLRALYYFDLLTFYSGHKNNDPGIPLYTEPPQSLFYGFHLFFQEVGSIKRVSYNLKLPSSFSITNHQPSYIIHRVYLYNMFL